MMLIMIRIALVNAVLASLFALLVRAAPARFRTALHAAMLGVAAVLYVVFAARAEAWDGVAVEAVGLALFGGAAVLGLRRGSARLLAWGWALHPLWDAVLHTAGSLAEYTPAGYVAACFGFDLALALWIGRGWAGIPVRPVAADARPLSVAPEAA
ncbi:MAG TPA: DUF6010 family protein [Longimicrobium sp.]|nr:DUF6010 family protein [Longimicrobium sp.]